MRKCHKIIIELLNAAINKKKILYSKKDNINWCEVINEANAHNISGLIYSAIDTESFKYFDKKLLERWKKEILLCNVTQIINIESTKKVISHLESEGIQVIVLKGLVVREYYPKPELRIMCDADLLIRKEDYDKVKDYLIKSGYICDPIKTPIHEEFYNEHHDKIEIHWKLVNDEYSNNKVCKFNEDIWNRIVEYNFIDLNTHTLGIEDFLMHLCIHMAVHSKYSGFGLRQVYDLGIFIKNKESEIDWDVFYKYACEYGMLKFIKGIFNVVNRLLGVNVPVNLMEDKEIKNKDVTLLIKDILLSGANGRRKECSDFKELYECKRYSDVMESKITRFKKLLFPKKEELASQYCYARKYTLLLPIAWIHRFIRGVIFKYGIKDSFITFNHSFKLGNMRDKIIKTFDL